MGFSVGSLRRESAEPNVSGFVWFDLSGFEQLSWDLNRFCGFGYESSDLVGFERICLDLTELGWISAELTVQIWVHFYEIWLDLGGCNRFEWILGGLG